MILNADASSFWGNFTVSVLAGVLTGFLTGFLTGLWATRYAARETARLAREQALSAAATFVGEWRMCKVFNGHLFKDPAHCAIDVAHHPDDPSVVHVVAVPETPSWRWEGDAVVNASLPTQATLMWSYTLTDPPGQALFGTYELLRRDDGRLFVEPSGATRDADYLQNVWLRPGPEYDALPEAPPGS